MFRVAGLGICGVYGVHGVCWAYGVYGVQEVYGVWGLEWGAGVRGAKCSVRELALEHRPILLSPGPRVGPCSFFKGLGLRV